VSRRAVFLDRDGTINEDVGYPSRVDQIRIYPYAFEALARIKAAGFLTVVVTNQSGIGRGYLTETDLAEIHRHMAAAFLAQGVSIDAFYYCPHHEAAISASYRKTCTCRKPETGLALRAAADLGIDLARSYMIGDKVEDILFGRAMGATPVLVRTGYGRGSDTALRERGVRPAAVVYDLLQAADWIITHDRPTP
jgi:D-glycero-D-manno-heptose 1,7-bisphosphate phosphatase